MSLNAAAPYGYNNAVPQKDTAASTSQQVVSTDQQPPSDGKPAACSCVGECTCGKSTGGGCGCTDVTAAPVPTSTVKSCGCVGECMCGRNAPSKNCGCEKPCGCGKQQQKDTHSQAAQGILDRLRLLLASILPRPK